MSLKSFKQKKRLGWLQLDEIPIIFLLQKRAKRAEQTARAEQSAPRPSRSHRVTEPPRGRHNGDARCDTSSWKSFENFFEKTRHWSSLEPENDVAIKGALWKWNDISPDLTNKHVRRKRSSLGDHPWYVLPTVFFCCLSAQTSLKIERNRVSYSRKKAHFGSQKMVHILVKKTFTNIMGPMKNPGKNSGKSLLSSKESGFRSRQF